ncbi:hypothetical protein JCM8097_006305 [Rhodosporidiobolus ruineniae]
MLTVDVLSERRLVGTKPSPLSSTHKLGPLDALVSTMVPISVVYIYQHAIDIDRLEGAVSVLLDHYPHLTGGLQVNPDTHEPSVGRLEDGMRFFTARASENLDLPPNVVVTDLLKGGNLFLPPFDPSFERVTQDPVFGIQHTTFPDGSTTLGIRVHHIICDAAGFFQLVRDLSEIYDTGTLSQEPHCESYLAGVDLTDEERKEALAYDPPYHSLDAPPQSFAAPDDVVSGRVYHLTPSILNNLQKAASSADLKATQWESLCALLYQEIYRARRQLGQVNATHFLTSVNVRPSYRLNLPPRYFPNALHLPYLSLPPDDLASAPLPSVAAAMHASFRSIDRDVSVKSTRWIATVEDKSRIGGAYPWSKTGLMSSAWSGFDIYRGVEFGAAKGEKPILVAPPFTPISLMNGLYYTFSRRDDNGLTLVISLCENVWAELDKEASSSVGLRARRSL